MVPTAQSFELLLKLSTFFSAIPTVISLSQFFTESIHTGHFTIIIIFVFVVICFMYAY